MVSTVLNMLFSIGINYYLTKILEPIQYGNYSFIINIFIFSQTLFNFGLFYSVCREISLANDSITIRKFYYAGIIIWLFLSLCMCISLFIYALNVDSFREKNILGVFLSILPLGTVYIFTQFNELVLQGDNRINLLSISRFFPRLLFFVCLLSIFFFNIILDLKTILIIYLSTYLIVYALIVHQIRPVASGLKNCIKQILSTNKTYGFHIYLGSLFAVGVSNFIGIALGLMSPNNETVGFYNIALQISIPLSLIPNIVSTVLYKRFMTSTINKKIILILIMVSTVSFILILIFAKPFIDLIFGEKYLIAVALLKYMCLGALLYGIADFFIKYLVANGYGKEVKKISIIVGITSLLIMYPFIYLWSCYGAALIKVIAGLVYLVVVIYTYNKILKSKKINREQVMQ